MAAIIEGYDRSSAEYLKALEDELVRTRVTRTALEDEIQQLKMGQAGALDVKDPNLMAALKLITDRLSQVEITLGDVATGAVVGQVPPTQAPPAQAPPVQAATPPVKAPPIPPTATTAQPPKQQPPVQARYIRLFPYSRSTIYLCFHFQSLPQT